MNKTTNLKNAFYKAVAFNVKAIVVGFTILASSFIAQAAEQTPDYIDENGIEYTINDAEKRTISVAKAPESIEGDVVIPNTVTINGVSYTVTRIEDWSFHYCKKMVSITFGESLSYLSPIAFQVCYSLKEINIDLHNPYFTSIDGILYNKDITAIVRYPNNKEGIYVFPNSIMRIEDRAFNDCRHPSFTSITIPRKINYIGKYAFSGCFLLKTIFMAIYKNDFTNNYQFNDLRGLSADEIRYDEDGIMSLNQPNGKKTNVCFYLDYRDINSTTSIKDYKIITCVVISAKSNDINLGEATATSDDAIVADDGSLWFKSYNSPHSITLTATPKKGAHFVVWEPYGYREQQIQLYIKPNQEYVAIFEKCKSITDKEEVPATCTKTGLTESTKCSVCQAELAKQEIIPMLDHVFGEYKYDNNATTETDGTETAHCIYNCGATDSRTCEGTRLTAPTAIADSEARARGIWAKGKRIIVENADNEIKVYNIDGRQIAKSAPAERIVIPIDKNGLYFVKVGNIAKQILIR